MSVANALRHDDGREYDDDIQHDDVDKNELELEL